MVGRDEIVQKMHQQEYYSIALYFVTRSQNNYLRQACSSPATILFGLLIDLTKFTMILSLGTYISGS